ncbi:hypothetical protein KDK_74270 [Dictyobacter kobayashii]|uniref:Major facilitator superfamily (MFS) profile domain-containing protein n=1 Tax=Dictyobacter kobayashii TaxID=2014872 RepID=A0A402AX13_9CHLR|nr:hypothetical protein KDK_74270 [Dictyobacter kobayashii]
MISASLLVQMPLFFLTYLAPSFWMQYPLIVLSTALAGFLWPTLGALMANRVQQHEQGQLAGVNTTLNNLMSVIGPLWAGTFYNVLGHGSPFWTWSIVLLVSWLLMMRVRP